MSWTRGRARFLISEEFKGSTLTWATLNYLGVSDGERPLLLMRVRLRKAPIRLGMKFPFLTLSVCHMTITCFTTSTRMSPNLQFLPWRKASKESLTRPVFKKCQAIPAFIYQCHTITLLHSSSLHSCPVPTLSNFSLVTHSLVILALCRSDSSSSCRQGWVANDVHRLK